MSYSGDSTTHVVQEGQRSAESVPHTSRLLLVALLLVAFLVGGAGTYAVLSYRAPRAHAAAAPMSVGSARVTAAVIEVKSAEPVTVSVDALPASAVRSSMTKVTFKRSSRSSIRHRVWIDDTLAGSDDEPLEVRCGKRTIKIGSQGKPRAFDLPCGRPFVVE